MQVIPGRMEERGRTEVAAELEQGNLKAKGRVGGREGSGSDVNGSFVYFHSFKKLCTNILNCFYLILQ